MERQDYTGCPVNFKSFAKSHKLKKRIRNALEKHLVLKDTQEPIIDEKMFEWVQELRAGKRRPTKLHFSTSNYTTENQDSYRCAKYKGNTGECTAHYIREETLKRLIYQRIFDVTALFYENITAFMDLIRKQRFAETEKEMKRRKKELEHSKKEWRNLTVFSNGFMRTKLAAQSAMSAFASCPQSIKQSKRSLWKLSRQSNHPRQL